MREDDHPIDDAESWDAIAVAWRQRDDFPRVHPPQLRQHVERETAKMRSWLIAEIALTVAAIAGTASHLARHRDTYAFLILIDTWVVVFIVWSFAVLGRWGLWTAAAETSAAYIQLGRRRAELKIRTTWLVVALVIGQLLVANAVEAQLSAFQWIAAAAWIAWAIWMHRRAKRERNYFLSLDRDV